MKTSMKQNKAKVFNTNNRSRKVELSPASLVCENHAAHPSYDEEGWPIITKEEMQRFLKDDPSAICPMCYRHGSDPVNTCPQCCAEGE